MGWCLEANDPGYCGSPSRPTTQDSPITQALPLPHSSFFISLLVHSRAFIARTEAFSKSHAGHARLVRRNRV